MRSRQHGRNRSARCRVGPGRMSGNEGRGSRERSLGRMLGSGDAQAGARQRAADDSVAVTVKYSPHSRPESRHSSYPAATRQRAAPLAVGTLEVGFLLLLQSLSHPSISILLADLSPARPRVASCSGLETQEDRG